MGKIGRNQPCPCGSGKKYKFCCGKENNIIQFPGTDIDPPPQTLGDPAGSLSHELLNAFSSKAPSDIVMDLEEFPGGFARLQDESPGDDFLGLGPSQMHKILNEAFEDNGAIVRFAPKVEWQDVDSIPFLEQALYFLTALGEQQPLPATKKGNLPRRFVQQVYENTVKKHLLFEYGYPNKEDDIRQIPRLRFVLTYAGLIKKYKNAFSLTGSASKMLRAKDWAGIYRSIFKGNSFKYSWACEDAYPDLWIVQHSLIFNLYILKQQAENYVPGKTLGQTYALAFPAAVYEAAESSTDPAGQVADCFVTRFLNRYAEPMGLIMPEPDPGSKPKVFIKDTRYKTTPLFHRIFDWQV